MQAFLKPNQFRRRLPKRDPLCVFRIQFSCQLPIRVLFEQLKRPQRGQRHHRQQPQPEHPDRHKRFLGPHLHDRRRLAQHDAQRLLQRVQVQVVYSRGVHLGPGAVHEDARLATKVGREQLPRFQAAFYVRSANHCKGGVHAQEEVQPDEDQNAITNIPRYFRQFHGVFVKIPAFFI